jgi:hypothetical protein
MKKLTWILVGLISLTLVYSFLNAQDRQSVMTSDFLIIRYNDEAVTLFQGNGSAERIKCKFDSNDCVINLLSQYQSEGYQIVSTTTAPTSKLVNSEAISVFLKKTK